MFEDLTVAFSGYNIKWFAVLAVESFLLFYPDLRKNIVYFDDESTDGTREELEARGIRVISWKYYSKDNKMYNEKRKNPSIINELSVRVCFIMREILMQCDTKYLLINDGDIVFKRGNFLEEYMKYFEEGNKVVAHEEYIITGITESDIEKQQFSELQNYYLQKRIKMGNKILTPRIHFMHAMVDADYFKEINLLFDSDEEQILEIIDGVIIDTGSDFYYKMADANIPAKYLNDEYVFDVLKHWGWVSSANKDIKKDTSNSYKDYESAIRKSIDEIGYIFEKTGIHPMRLLVTHNKTKNKG